MKLADKKRWQIKNDKICALYGHSIKKHIHYKEIKPNSNLYHGTAVRFLSNIKKQGLLPMERQMVCLSIDIETAKTVAKRHDAKHIAVIQIDIKQALHDGVKFYEGNDNTVLVKKLPAKYFEKIIYV